MSTDHKTVVLDRGTRAPVLPREAGMTMVQTAPGVNRLPMVFMYHPADIRVSLTVEMCLWDHSPC